MALGLPSGGSFENRTPVIKYDGRAGRLFRVDRTQVNGSWQTDAVEVTPVFQAVMDLERIELGWLHFPSGAAPSMAVAPFGQPIPAKPSDQHRAGFRLLMLLGKQAGGDVREMAANAQVSVKGMDALHDAYLAGAALNPGKLPVVKLARTTPVTTQGKGPDGKPVSSTNYQPGWEIVSWVDRPAALTELGGVVDSMKATALSSAPATSQAPAAPLAPAAPQAPAAASASVEDDF